MTTQPGSRFTVSQCVHDSKLEKLSTHSSDSAQIETFEDDQSQVIIFGDVVEPTHIKNRRAEWLAHAYQDQGVHAFAEMSGRFIATVFDKSLGHTYAFVDRMSQRTLFYGSKDNALFLSDHAGDICDLVESTEISKQAIFQYLYFHMIPSPNTVFEAVKKLPPASYLHWDGHKVRVEHYWKPTFKETGSPYRRLSNTLQKTLSAATSDALVKGSTGCFLSGGLDSSTVSGLAQQHSQQKVPCITVGFDEPDYDESPFAAIAADHFEVDHQIVKLTPEQVLEYLPEIVKNSPEPFGNSSALPTYHCAKHAKSMGLQTLLAGDGGDELFAGNSRYSFQKLFDYYQYLPGFMKKPWLENVTKKLAQIISIKPAKKIARYIEQAQAPLAKRLQDYNFIYRFGAENIFEDAFLQSIDPNQAFSEWSSEFDRFSKDSPLHQMLAVDWKFTLADNDLVKVGQMCDLAEINVRYPMLSNSMVDLSCEIPENWKLKGQSLRHFYKKSFESFLHTDTLNKSKHGFGLPFGVWMATHTGLKEYAHKHLERLKTRGIFKSTFIDDVCEKHQTGHAAYYGELVWLLMMLEAWLSEHAKPSANKPSEAAEYCSTAS